MPSVRRRARRPLRGCAAAALATALVTAGCGSDTGSDEHPGDAGTTWTPSAHPVSSAGLIWAADGTIHLGDGSTLVTDQQIASYVVAGDGAYVVPQTTGDAPDELLLVTADRIEQTGAQLDPGSLVSSPDGRYLGYVDLTTGTEDTFGTPVATAVVVDLREGEEVLRTTDGMGDPEGGDDLADLYEDADGPAVGLTDDTAYVISPDGTFAHDLSTGERTEESPEPSTPTTDTPAFATNPSGTWSVAEPRRTGSAPLLVPASGKPVATTSPYDRWFLNSWLDDSTAVGFRDEDGGLILLTCAVPTGRCDTVPGTEDGALLPADRQGYGAAIVTEPILDTGAGS